MVLQGQPCGRVGRCRGFEGSLARVGLHLFSAHSFARVGLFAFSAVATEALAVATEGAGGGPVRVFGGATQALAVRRQRFPLRGSRWPRTVLVSCTRSSRSFRREPIPPRAEPLNALWPSEDRLGLAVRRQRFFRFAVVPYVSATALPSSARSTFLLGSLVYARGPVRIFAGCHGGVGSGPVRVSEEPPARWPFVAELLVTISNGVDRAERKSGGRERRWYRARERVAASGASRSPTHGTPQPRRSSMGPRLRRGHQGVGDDLQRSRSRGAGKSGRRERRWCRARERAAASGASRSLPRAEPLSRGGGRRLGGESRDHLHDQGSSRRSHCSGEIASTITPSLTAFQRATEASLEIR